MSDEDVTLVVLIAIVLVVLFVWDRIADDNERQQEEDRRVREQAVEQRRKRRMVLAEEARQRQRMEDEARVKAAVEADLEMERRAKAEGTYVRDYVSAEGAMERAMVRYLGFTDARCTGGGADEGIDIVASAALAQVKFLQKTKVSRSDVQRLVGAKQNSPAYSHAKLLFFAFGDAPYSRLAIDYADGAQVALFCYNVAGEVFPTNAVAATIEIRDDHLAARAHTAQQARHALRTERTSKARVGDPCRCGGHFVLRRRGSDKKRFLGCTNYPHCVETRNI